VYVCARARVSVCDNILKYSTTHIHTCTRAASISRETFVGIVFTPACCVCVCVCVCINLFKDSTTHIHTCHFCLPRDILLIFFILACCVCMCALKKLYNSGKIPIFLKKSLLWCVYIYAYIYIHTYMYTYFRERAL